MTFLPIDESEISLDDYINITRQVAQQQRELIDYISLRDSADFELFTLQSLATATATATATTVTKTKTKDIWGMATYFSITTTYNVSGTQISYMRNSQINYKLACYIADAWLSNISSPKYSYLDGGRTGAVRYTADLYYGSSRYGNIVLYTEYYYSE